MENWEMGSWKGTVYINVLKLSCFMLLHLTYLCLTLCVTKTMVEDKFLHFDSACSTQVQVICYYCFVKASLHPNIKPWVTTCTYGLILPKTMKHNVAMICCFLAQIKPLNGDYCNYCESTLFSSTYFLSLWANLVIIMSIIYNVIFYYVSYFLF